MASMFFNKGKHSRRRASAAVPSSVPSVTFHTLMIMKFYKRSLAFAIAKTRGVIRKALHASGGNQIIILTLAVCWSHAHAQACSHAHACTYALRPAGGALSTHAWQAVLLEKGNTFYIIGINTPQQSLQLESCKRENIECCPEGEPTQVIEGNNF